MKALFDLKRFKFYAWVGLACFALGVLVDVGQHPAEAGRRILNNFWLGSYLTGVNYVLLEYTVPRLRWAKFMKSLLLVVLHIFLYAPGLYLWRHTGIRIHLYTSFITAPGESYDTSDAMGVSMSSIFVFGITRHIYNHIRLRQTAQQLRIEKQQAELNYLKSQTNPHFLFNTLNNIYSLARDKSDLAPEMILRLSQILRYMLYETGGPYVAVEQELKIIGDYISLEKLRYDDSLSIRFHYDVEDMKQALPPLLLIPLVENAFKHGVSETRSRPFVEVHLSIVRRQLTFFVKNSTEEFSGEGTLRENIGLSNLRRQLELLYTDYTISLEQKASGFSATLKINLASHV